MMGTEMERVFNTRCGQDTKGKRGKDEAQQRKAMGDDTSLGRLGLVMWDGGELNARTELMTQLVKGFDSTGEIMTGTLGWIILQHDGK